MPRVEVIAPLGSRDDFEADLVVRFDADGAGAVLERWRSPAYDEWNRMYLDEWALPLRHVDSAGVMLRLLHVDDDRDDLSIAFEWVPRLRVIGLVHSEGGRGGLALPLVRAVMLAVARGLAAIHASELAIIHRNIGPRTVAISTDGTVRVDWRAWRAAGSTTTTTRTAGRIKGSFEHMSPEQIQGRVISFESDVFSLGALAYQLLTGISPFKRENEIDTLMAIHRNQREPLLDARGDVPEPLASLVERMLQPVPEHRPTAAHVAAVLAETLAWATWDEETVARELRSLVPREVEEVLALDDRARAVLMRGAA